MTARKSAAPSSESIRGERVLASNVTPQRFYQAVFPSGNVYYVKALAGGGFEVISQESVVNRSSLSSVGDVMTMFDGNHGLSGKLYKFTERPRKSGKAQKRMAKAGDFVVVQKAGLNRVKTGEVVRVNDDFIINKPRYDNLISVTRENGEKVNIFQYRMEPVEFATAWDVQPEMLAYPKDTIGKTIGAKVGDQFIVLDPRPGTKRGDILTLSNDDGSNCPFFKDASGKLVCTFWSRLAPLVPAVPEPVKPIRAAIQIGDRVVYDASKHEGGVGRLTGTHGTVLNVLNQSDEVHGVITVRWDNGEENGHAPACILPLVEKPVTMAEAHEELAEDTTYALEAESTAPVDPVTACKQRIDAAKAEIERLASEQRVADKVLRDAQDDLRKELKGYLPEPNVAHPFDEILRHLNKQAGAGIGGRGLLGFPFGGL